MTLGDTYNVPAEVAEIRPVECFAPEDIHTPHLYVNRLVQSTLSRADVQGASA